MHKKSIQSIFKDISFLSSGIAVGQFIAILFQPVLRRIYPVEDFGVFAIYIQIINILVIVASLRLEAAIVLPKNKIIAANLFFLSLIISVFFNGIVLFFILIFKSDLLKFFNISNAYENWFYFIPLVTLLFSFYQTLNYFLIRLQRYKAIAINKISRRGVEAISQFFFGISKVNLGLLYGDLAGHLVNCISGIIQLPKNQLQFGQIRRKIMVYAIQKYKDFPLYNTIPLLLNTLSFAIPIFLVNKYYSHTDTGYFELTLRVLAIPSALIASALSQVLYQRLTEYKNNNQRFNNEFRFILLFLTSIALVGILVIELFGESIFGILFGTNYRISGFYSKVLVLSFGLKFIVSPLSAVFPASGKLKKQAVWQILYFVIILSLLFFKDMTLYNFIIAYMLIDFFCYIFYFILITKTFHKEF